MNKVVLLTQFSKPNIWLKLGLLLIIFVVLLKGTFLLVVSLLSEDEAAKMAEIKTLELTLKDINVKSTKLLALEKKLPNLAQQVAYAEPYFQSYGLDFEPRSVPKNNRQTFTISGDLKAVILSVYDIRQTSLLVDFKSIVINNSLARVETVIFGRDDEKQ